MNIKKIIDDIRLTAGDGEDRAICAVSGGVDSTVTALLAKEALGDRCNFIFIDNGLLRTNEADEVINIFNKLNITIKVLKKEQYFLEQLKGIRDPEEKRKKIGAAFIKVFEDELKNMNIKYLFQGTIKIDVEESINVKSHHNVGGLPSKMKLKLIEPIKHLDKNEVRKLGSHLLENMGLNNDLSELFNRKPFPGPALAIRIMGEVTKDALNILRRADDIWIKDLKETSYYQDAFQVFSILMSDKSTAFKNNKRYYERVLALKAIESIDGKNAKPINIDFKILEKISVKIIEEIEGISRVVYDISPKPYSTIEWE